LTISGLAGPSLTAGQTYFVVIDPDPSTSFGWNWNNQGVTGRVEQSADGGATWGPGNIQALSAFEILGEPGSMPEPAAMLLLGAGLLCLAARGSRRVVR
jgi:hypothetical protein